MIQGCCSHDSANLIWQLWITLAINWCRSRPWSTACYLSSMFASGFAQADRLVILAAYGRETDQCNSDNANVCAPVLKRTYYKWLIKWVNLDCQQVHSILGHFLFFPLIHSIKTTCILYLFGPKYFVWYHCAWFIGIWYSAENEGCLLVIFRKLWYLCSYAFILNPTYGYHLAKYQ